MPTLNLWWRALRFAGCRVCPTSFVVLASTRLVPADLIVSLRETGNWKVTRTVRFCPTPPASSRPVAPASPRRQVAGAGEQRVSLSLRAWALQVGAGVRFRAGPKLSSSAALPARWPMNDLLRVVAAQGRRQISVGRCRPAPAWRRAAWPSSPRRSCSRIRPRSPARAPERPVRTSSAP